MDIRREFAKRTGENDAGRIERIVSLAIDDHVKNGTMTQQQAHHLLYGEVSGNNEADAHRFLETMLLVHGLLKRQNIDF